ncbi:MAG: TatD family hydrolase [Candidatus Moraniibacteriota bacterium]
MYDIHTHLYMPQYDVDRDAVIARARVAGIDGMFAIGCTVDESRQCVALAEEHPEIFASVGIHPHEFLADESRMKNQEFWLPELRELARHPKVIAIGECGLDYFGRENPVTEEVKGRQREGFLLQLDLAQECKLPVIIHCRDAYGDLFDILSDSKFQNQDLRFILHCYMGDTEATKQFLELPNVYFSFTGNITYPVKAIVAGTKDDLRETVKLIPLDRLLIETDCPFLAPQTKRGERNEPAYVSYVGEAAAKLHGVDQTVVEMKTRENVRCVFGKMIDQV